MEGLELFGFLGSLLVALSLMMKNILKLRWINLVGASVFVIYGLLIEAYPVFVLNGFIVLVDLYYILMIYREKSYFTLLEVEDGNELLRKFVDFYKDDIKSYFPEFSEVDIKEGENIFIMRNVVPVGYILYSKKEEGTAEVIVDYAVKDYRDLENGKYFFKQRTEYFTSKGVNKLLAKSYCKDHKKYLQKVGFQKDEKEGSFVKVLD